ncbi:hypothetical protein ACJMK2_002923, partial [Sinanodonta woodiana]
MEKAMRLLESKHYVLIKGNPGEGKTTMALHLIDKDNYQGRRVLVSSPRDWENVVIDCVDIVIIENIFGQFDFDSARLQDWMIRLHTIQEYVDSGRLQLIITSRIDILTKAYSSIRLHKLFCDGLSVMLSSEQLTHSEKMIILNSELLRHSRAMTDDEKEKCIQNFSGFIGFPQCCFLFAGHVELFDKGAEFFRSPDHFFVENITMLDEERFLSLAFLFCNGEILEEQLSPKTMPERSKLVLDELATQLPFLNTNVSLKLLRDSYDSFMGLYTMKSMSCIRFAHDTVFEAVGQVLADRCVKMVVKYSFSEYLYQKTYTAKDKDSASHNVFVPDSMYGLLAKRMVCDIIDEDLLRSVVQHSALRQHTFLMKLKEELMKVNKVNVFFTVNTYIESIVDPILPRIQEVVNKEFIKMTMFRLKLPPIYRHRLLVGECSTFMQYVLQCDEDVVQIVYSQLLELLTCSHNHESYDCWKCKETQNLLELTLYYQRFQITDVLITMGARYTHLSLCNAARHGDLIRVQTIIQTLKMHNTFNPESEEAKDALCRAYTSGNKDLVELLLKESVTLSSIHVAYAAQHGDLNVLKNIVDHLKYHNNWNPHSEYSILKKLVPSIRCFDILYSIRPIFSAMYITLSEEKFQMAEYLIENEVRLTLDLLVYLSGSGSHQAVAKLIQYFKVAGIWDPHSYCASKALEHAYIAHNFEVFDLLVHKGVSFTIQSLAAIAVFQPSLESFKKVLQHLKDTDNWDSTCDEASKALEITWNQKHGICDLLIQEGVTLKMKNLHGLLNGVSLESAKKAIEHLKDAGNWNCKCDEASKALEISYGQAYYDVQDLLVKEGVTLQMKNFPASVMEVHNSKSAEKAMQHLKEIDNWDSTCEDASKALQIAYILHNYDVVELLLAEKVTLTMKHLPGVLAASLSVKCVKKVIELLKYSHNWDSNCHDASKALEIAYIQHKNDVCDMLKEENVTLTMTNLPSVIVDSLSPECIKTIIQSLKDTDNWDSKCNDASKALEIAYREQNNDVSTILVQEGVTLHMNNLPGAIMGSKISLEFVKTTISDLQKTGKWDSKCDDASKTLVAACILKQYDTFDMLVREGVQLAMLSLHYILMSFEVSLESVKKAIQHLKDISKWDYRSRDAINVLVHAYCIEIYDVCDLLVQEGVTLTMKNLPDVANFASLESVKKVIQHLKETGSWNSKCDDASTVLMVYYIRQMYDVCDFLVNEGISLTMTNLALVVTDCVSVASVQKRILLAMTNAQNMIYNVALESVQKASEHLNGNTICGFEYDVASKVLGILEMAYGKQEFSSLIMLDQLIITLPLPNYTAMVSHGVLDPLKKTIKHLKETNNWDCTCEEALQALVIAYSKERYDVCALLVQEGLTLTMKCLGGVVSNSSLIQSVHKAVQHLRENDNMDPKCAGASAALSIAYSQQKHDVCTLLVQEGFTLSMNNLPSIAYHGSLESIRKAIQHLADISNWDCKCDDGLHALAIAYSKEKYDICHLLVQEGLALKMKNLPEVVANSAQLESVQKAVQHLKENARWDFSRDDAQKALVIAYSQHKYDVCLLLVQEQVKLTMNTLSGVVANSVTVESVKKAIQHLKDSKMWDSTCDDARKALVIANSKQKYDLFDLLIQEQIILRMMNLPVMVGNSASLESVKKAIQHLKDNNMWDSTCDDARKALAIAYSQEKYDVCALLVQDNVILTMETLPGVVVNSVALESVKKAIQHLKDNGKWDSTCDDAPKASVIAYIQEKYDVCSLMIQEKVIMPMNYLPELVSNTLSCKSVKNAVQDIKENNKWDSNNDGAQNALVIAYSQQKYDVCALLVQEKVILTMKNLPRVVVNSVALESVKRAIQHLKDSGNWDSTCDDAPKALVIAYIQEKYDVCAFLILEQVILTTNNLPWVVANSGSFESVKKAIQHLKDNDKWDSTCDNTKTSLVIAYSQEKYDVCAFLIQEKVILTMVNFPGMVAKSASLESIKKAIQHLKDNDKWNNTCDDAQIALAIAYRQHMDDVCNLLVQEYVILTMNNFPMVVASSLSFESVKKAIQHLKDNGKWDCTCPDAPKALVIAYSQHMYDVCALLVQEQVILTMEFLPVVVSNCVSLESIKNAIQHLKDTSNWDSNSVYSPHALLIAYFKEHYDISDLLIKEGLRLAMKNLPGMVANIDSLESIMKAIQHLKNFDRWDFTCDYAKQSLGIAYSQQKHDVCTLLIQEQVILTMKNLPEVVGGSVAFVSVEKAIQHLKDQDKWDSTSDDATKALAIAYSQQMQNVCAMLVQEKVILTMRHFPGVVAHCASLEYVNKAIRHLKDNNKWDARCDDAQLSLVIAYSKQIHALENLLLHEQVILTMSNLPGVVGNSLALEPVKKAIQHLKDNDKWDSTIDEASKSLEIAYSQQKYDLCAVLIQENIKLNMKNLPGIISTSDSLESVKRTIQHLKDNGKWDPAYDDAQKGLVIAFSQQKNDVCAFLVQEKIMLTMSNFPEVVAISVTLESVKKAIQQLTTNGKWISTRDDAQQALVIFQSHKVNDGCAFPIQEKRLLTMSSIHGLVANSIALESVTKAIQHLKDNDKWDSTCDDASEALMISYSHKMNDLCAFLVQERLKLTMKTLPRLVANSASLESVQKAVQHMKDNDKWNTTCDDASEALVIAYSHQKYDVCALLLQEQVTLTMKNLPRIVANSVALEAIGKALQHLGDQHMWDSACDDAPEALVIAYSQQKYDVCDLLIQEQVILTMKNLPGLVANSESLESVKKAIQHLKDNMKWDSRCDDASKTLVIAHIQHKLNVCALLVQEQVMLIMKNLPQLVANSVSLDSVKKAIQDLKVTYKWDSTCGDAPKALVIAYSQQKYDVCALLAQENVLLTMSDLHEVMIACLLFEYIKKATQHQKDNDFWDARADDELQAVVLGYSQETYNVIDLLIPEISILTISNLHRMLANSALLESVQKAIQHLKDNDKWDATSDDASKALVIAYSQQKYALCAFLVQENLKLKMKNLPEIVANSVSLDSVKKTILHLKDNGIWDTKCVYALNALVIAFSRQKYDVCAFLIQEKIILTMVNLPEMVANSASIKSVKKAIQHLKDNDKWNTMCDDASEALVIAYSHQKYDVCALLVQEHVTLTTKTLPRIVATSTSLESVKQAFNNLKDNEKWDPTCVDASKALEIAYSQQKYDLCALLEREKLILTMKNLPWLVANSVALKTIAKALQHLGDHHMWDSACDDAPEALMIAYSQCKYDVCDLLIQEQVILTMKNLPWLVANSESLESVKKAIEHLKYNMKWDSRCDDASKTLAIAYIQQKLDVCALLVQEQVMLIMKNLPQLVANSVSTDSVKKAIQDLKDTDKWDSTCGDAPKALVLAYSQQRYDVCALLAQENVLLTMSDLHELMIACLSFEYVKKEIHHQKNNDFWDVRDDDELQALVIAHIREIYVCPFVIKDTLILTMSHSTRMVANSALVESFQKVIHHLKDNGKWDSTCADAPKALMIAYSQQKCDVCELLIQKQVILKMTNLPGVVSNSVALEPVKKAIQHLKDNVKWDSTCDEASKTLVIAYSQQRIDVCALLIQEQVMLKMNNLPQIVANSVSLEYVKKAIQHLKDNDKWDSMCHDASKALVIAYSQHKYDLCDLLIQENIVLTMSNLHEVIIASLVFEYFIKPIHHPKDNGVRDLRADDELQALFLAYSQELNDVLALMIQEICILTISNLHRMLPNNALLESVQKAIQHLKDNDKWDAKCDDASKALVIAYSQHKCDVCELLIQEQVILTMTNLPGVVSNSVALEPVKKAIQHLKDNVKWDSTCDEASKTLVIAYSQQRIDVCALLIQEQVMLKMNNLPQIVANSVSLEYVKKAIQHLKDNDKWDSMCHDASKALVIAYSQHKYDLCDLLIQENIVLTMSNLHEVIIASLVFEYFIKPIHHPKDNGVRDLRADDELQALFLAYSQELNDVLALMIQEICILTISNLHRMLPNNALLESVQKAIQHLKDNDKWDAKCDDASKALVIACIQQKYHVCEWLIQEQVILTMKNLPEIVAISVSLDSVRKTIHQLKYNGIWDSKCAYALVALLIAFSMQKYDVCDLLVHEHVILTMRHLPFVVAT